MSSAVGAAAVGSSAKTGPDAGTANGKEDAKASKFEGPVQIITVNETGDAFQLHEAKLNFVLRNVPKDLPVAILSVVGAFRTGKSFLLDLFLRYLRYYEENPDAIASPESRDWLGAVDAPLEGQANTGAAPEFSAISSAAAAAAAAKKKAQAQAAAESANGSGGGESSSSSSSHAAAKAGFKWRSGRERTTTGIWLWSRPFIRTLPNGDRVAVLVMDTQGLFDTDTAQMLTTSIFGLSTLISSHVIYNLPNRIQEDYLQNLALFSEYGRRVLEAQRAAQEEASATGADEEDAILGSASASLNGAEGDDSTAAAPGDEKLPEKAAGGSSAISSPQDRLASMRRRRRPASSGAADATPPFQRIDLLVRDADIESDVHDWDSLRAEMGTYLSTVLSKTHHEDLRTVREHIAASFETVSCFLLPHPGLHVRKADFDGSVRGLEPDFITVLCYFMHATFHENTVAKKVNGRVVKASQLQRYVEAYARLFQDRAIFPEAKVLLDATADANNRNALDAALGSYQDEMEEFFKSTTFAKDEEVAARCDAAEAEALDTFDSMANFGSSSSIKAVRQQLLEHVAKSRASYMARNAERNPLRHVELYVFALAIAVAAYVLRMVADYTCAPWADVCRRGSQLFGFIYTAIFVALLAVMYITGRRSWDRINFVLQALLNMGGASGAAAALAGAGAVAPAPSAAPVTTSNRHPGTGGARTQQRGVSPSRSSAAAPGGEAAAPSAVEGGSGIRQRRRQQA